MSQPTVKSAIRAFAVLEVFERHQRALSLKEITQELGYPASSGSALLKSMLEIGYLDYNKDRRLYFPTLRVALLGQWVEGMLFGENHLLEAMQWLHEQSGEGVILATQSDLHVQYLQILYSDHPLQFRARPGLRRPIARTGLGWAILASRSDAEIEHILRRINAQSEDKVNRAALMARIDEIRSRGYSFSKSTFTEGVGIIGMVVPQAAFNRTLALGVAGYVGRLERDEDRIVDLLRSAITNIVTDNSTEKK